MGVKHMIPRYVHVSVLCISSLYPFCSYDSRENEYLKQRNMIVERKEVKMKGRKEGGKKGGKEREARERKRERDDYFRK